jgi:hypothetical protein
MELVTAGREHENVELKHAIRRGLSIRKAALVLAVWVTALGCGGAAPDDKELGQKANAIARGALDGDSHPNVGAVLAVFPSIQQPLERSQMASAVLIHPSVVLTTGLVTDSLLASASGNAAFDNFAVTFASAAYSNAAVLVPILGAKTYHSNDPGTDTPDVGVLFVDPAFTAGIGPGGLPPVGCLDGLRDAGLLDSPGAQPTRFTEVGYGQASPSPVSDGFRRYAISRFLNLRDNWLDLEDDSSSKDSGAACFGDWGGGIFIPVGGIEQLVAVIAQADCITNTVGARIDTAAVRSFLDDAIGSQ